MILPRTFGVIKSYTLRLVAKRAIMNSTSGPLEALIFEKLQDISPTFVKITNDSHKHSHHRPMVDAKNTTESHFKVEIVSDQFIGKSLPQRHRMIYKLLDDEFKLHGLHALQLQTRTSDEARLILTREHKS